MTRAAATTSKFLRFIAILQLLTALIAFVPESLLAAFHVKVGLGPLPHLPMFLYVVRGASYCQGAIGVLLWIIASDVVRYRALFIATGAIYLVAGPAFFLIHTESGTPLWWALMDSVSCLVIGAIILWQSMQRVPAVA